MIASWLGRFARPRWGCNVLSMSSTLKRLGIDSLGVAERLELIGEIWDSVARDPDRVPVPESHLMEIERRLAEFSADGDRGAPAEAVIDDIKRLM